MRWILFIFVCLVSLPTQAVTIPRHYDNVNQRANRADERAGC